MITNQTLPSSLLGTGTQTFAKFTVSSQGYGEIEWNKILFTVTKTARATTGPVITDATLWNADTNVEVAGADTITTLTATDAAGSIAFVPTTPESVSGAVTYILKGSLAATLATGDNVNTNIASPAVGYNAPDAYADVLTNDATTTFAWSDVSAASHATTTNDWNNNNLVKNLPTDAQTLSK